MDIPRWMGLPLSGQNSAMKEKPQQKLLSPGIRSFLEGRIAAGDHRDEQVKHA